MVAAVWLDRQGAVGIDLPAQDLAVLHPEAAGLAAFRPLPDIPAKKCGKEEEMGVILYLFGGGEPQAWWRW